MIINSKWVVNIINAKDVNMKRKVRPNVVSGGTAINLGNNLYYMRGKTHKQGGIDIGSNPKTGIEVENGEVVQTSPTGLRVFSAQPILNGISPANALLMGGNPNNIFNAQEAWKQANHYNDDGTKFKDGGYTPSQEIIDYIKKTEGFRDKWYKDGNGIDTIGYGFTGSRIKKLYPNGITREQADKEFADSIAKRALILAKDTPNWNKLSQSQRDALLSYHYNVGEGSYRNKHKKLQQALADSDWENVILNMDAGYNDKKNPGLRTRRDYERELFRSGMVASLTGDEEKAFRDWYDRYSRSQNLDPNPDAKEHYYDYRTYWKNRTPEQMNDEWKLGNHLPDTYKMPGHPTFSTESIYSTRKTPGGTWKKVGLGPVYDEQFVDSKYTKNLRKYQNVSFKYGGIHIKPSKRGTFTAAAKRHHMSVQEFARTVLNNRARYSAAMVKKANFARNASKWHKKELGGDMTKQYYITRDNIYSLGGNIRRKALLGDDNTIPIEKIKVNNRDAWDVNGKIVYSEAEAYRLARRFADAQATLDMSGPIDSSIVYGSMPIRDSLTVDNPITSNTIPIKKIKVNNRDAWEVGNNPSRIVYSEAEAYRLAGKFADANATENMSETLEPSAIEADRVDNFYNIVPGKSNGKNIWTVGNRVHYSYESAKRHRDQLLESASNVENGAIITAERNKENDNVDIVSNQNQQNTDVQPQRTRLQINTSGRPTTDILGITTLRPYNGQQTDSANRTRLPIDTSGRPTARAIGFAQLRPYDGRPIESPTSGTQSSPTGGQRRNTRSSVSAVPIVPVDNDSINRQIDESNQRILRESIAGDLATPITSPRSSGLNEPTLNSLIAGLPEPNYSTAQGSIIPTSSVGRTPANPYYSRLNVGLHKIGNYIKNNPDLIGLGVNLTGNLAASLINRSAIKGMRYGDAPIPISAQKLPTEVNIEPQISSIRENVAGQERLIADNTADSRVALARRQRVRNQGAQQYQTLFGNKLNTELQLLTADRLNRQGVDTQNVTQYNQWRRGLYDFENRRREMLAENAVAGINNAAEAIAGERGYLARREARKQDARNRALIALTSPNAQKVFDANPGLYEELIRKMSKYGGNFNLLTKRLKK